MCGKPLEKGWVRPLAFFAKGHPELQAFASLGYLDGNRKRHIPGTWNGAVHVEAVCLASAGTGDDPFKPGLAGADVLVMALESGGEGALGAAEAAAAGLAGTGWLVLFDDRRLPDEVRLAEAKLTGSPVKVLVTDARNAEIAKDEAGSPERIPLEDAGRFLEPMRIV